MDGVRSDPVHAGDDAGGCSRSAAIEDADSDERNALGHAVGRPADRSGYVSAVSVAVLAIPSIADRVVANAGASAEIVVRSANAGVDDVRVYVRRSGVVSVVAVEWKIALIDAIESPRRAALGGLERDLAVFLDVLHARVQSNLRSVRVGD